MRWLIIITVTGKRTIADSIKPIRGNGPGQIVVYVCHACNRYIYENLPIINFCAVN